MRLAKPIVKKIEDNAKALKSFEATLSSEEKAKEIISSYPTVYIHNWKKTDGMKFILESRTISFKEPDSIMKPVINRNPGKGN